MTSVTRISPLECPTRTIAWRMKPVPGVFTIRLNTIFHHELFNGKDNLFGLLVFEKTGLVFDNTMASLSIHSTKNVSIK